MWDGTANGRETCKEKYLDNRWKRQPNSQIDWDETENVCPHLHRSMEEKRKI